MGSAVLHGPFRALASPRFAAFWVAQAVSIVADRAYLAAFAVQLGVIDHRPGLASIAFAAYAVGSTAPLLLAGSLIDRHGARGSLMAGDLIRFGATVLLAATFSAGTAVPAIWIITATLVGVGESLYSPAFATAIPSLVSDDTLASANGLRQSAQMLGSTLGPLLIVSGVATGHVGAIFWFQALTFGLAAVSALVVPRRAAGLVEPVESPGLFRHAIEGARFALRDRALTGAAVVFLITAFAVEGPRFIALPLHAASTSGLGLGTAGFAWLASVGGLGALVGSLFWGRRERAAGEHVRAVTFSVLLLGGGWALVGTSSPQVALLAIFVAGFAIVGANIVLYSALQARIAPARLGRTFAFIELASYIGSPASFLVVGALVTFTDPGRIVVWSGAAIILVGIVAAGGILRSLDTLET